MRLLLIVLLSSIYSIVYSQTDFNESFGRFSTDEISYKECQFDKQANAVVLFDKAVSNYDDRWSLITMHRVRIKVLNDKGLDYGNIHIPYYSGDDFEFIKDIQGVVATFDDQKNLTISKLEQKNIFTTKENNYYSQITFALPNVKAGSILEYAYTSVMKHYGGLQKWIFQWEIPVLVSSYELFIIPDHEFTYSVKKAQFLPIDIKPEPQVGKISFVMKNIPGLRDEDYMASEKDYLQQVTFQLSGFADGFGTKKVATTWKDMANDLLNEKYFGVQLNKDLTNTTELKSLCEKVSTPTEKLKAIYDYVRFGLVWDGYSGIYSDDGIKSAWEKKKGNAADINLILVNLLRAYGFDAYPMLISERDHGKVDTTYPFRQQFNKVIAFVKLNDKQYFLDGVNKSTPFGMIPYKFLNTKAFIVDRKKSALVTISDNSKQYKDVINIIGKIDPSGSVNGEASIYNFDYSRIEKINDNKTDIDKYKEYYSKKYSNCKLDSFSLSGLNADSLPLTESFKLTSSLNKSGNYYMLNYNLFSNIDKNPFVTDIRFSNIDFGCLRSCYLNESYTIPNNLAIESLPKNSTLRTPDNSMTLSRIIEKENDNIHVVVRVDIKRAEFVSSEYDMVRGFYKQMIDFLSEPVVFKTK